MCEAGPHTLVLLKVLVMRLEEDLDPVERGNSCLGLEETSTTERHQEEVLSSSEAARIGSPQVYSRRNPRGRLRSRFLWLSKRDGSSEHTSS